ELRPCYNKTSEIKANGGEMASNGDAAVVGQLSAQLVELSKQLGSAGSDNTKLDVIARLLSEAQRSVEQERSARDALVTKVLELGKGEPPQQSSTETISLVRELINLSEKLNKPTPQKSTVEELMGMLGLIKEMRAAFQSETEPTPVTTDMPWWL